MASASSGDARRPTVFTVGGPKGAEHNFSSWWDIAYDDHALDGVDVLVALYDGETYDQRADEPSPVPFVDLLVKPDPVLQEIGEDDFEPFVRRSLLTAESENFLKWLQSGERSFVLPIRLRYLGPGRIRANHVNWLEAGLPPPLGYQHLLHTLAQDAVEAVDPADSWRPKCADLANQPPLSDGTATRLFRHLARPTLRLRRSAIRDGSHTAYWRTPGDEPTQGLVAAGAFGRGQYVAFLEGVPERCKDGLGRTDLEREEERRLSFRAAGREFHLARFPRVSDSVTVSPESDHSNDAPARSNSESRAVSDQTDAERPTLGLPAGTQWSNITMEFVTAHSVRIHVDGTDLVQRCTYREMGLAHKRSGKPTQGWNILLAFVSRGYWPMTKSFRGGSRRSPRSRQDRSRQLSSSEWASSGDRAAARERLTSRADDASLHDTKGKAWRRLRRALSASFGIADDPVESDKERHLLGVGPIKHAWWPKFEIRGTDNIGLADRAGDFE